MIPNRKIAETRTPDDGHLTLLEHDGDFSIRLNGHGLMNSRNATSERLLGSLGHRRAARHSRHPRYLVGGLGMGVTLRSLLDGVSSRASVTVVELIPDVVRWNSEFFARNNGAAIDDPRVEVMIEDVWEVLRCSARERFDAILLDIDNGPFPLVQTNNLRLYYRRGIQFIAQALKPGGRAAFWSAGRDDDFFARLCKADFEVDVVPTRQSAGSRSSTCFIYVADKKCEARTSRPAHAGTRSRPPGPSFSKNAKLAPR